MRLEGLRRWTDRSISLTPELWAKARLLGKAREQSNDGIRAEDQERGLEGNYEVDLQGAAAELILLTWARRNRRTTADEAAIAAMQAHLYDPEGGGNVTGADLEFEDEDERRTIRIDAKSFACQIKQDPETGREIRYSRFAINADKHAELGRLACDAYFCVVTPHYGRRALISALVPWADVDHWEVRPLRRGGSPSRNLPMRDLLGRYARDAERRARRRFRTLDDLEVLRTELHAVEDVEVLMRKPNVCSSLREEVPALAEFLDDWLRSQHGHG